ncbi:MAG: hypothetical protein VB070_08600 [Clostridiaceae bacterium]|nr:hypothetical protein [Clostridiaceae bacterium]
MQFHEKLNVLMDVFKISNSKLARGINVDASLISRWKTGERKIATNSPHIPALATYFLRLNAYPYQRDYLNHLIVEHMPDDEIDNEANRVRTLSNWFITPEQSSIPPNQNEPVQLKHSARLISQIAGLLNLQQKDTTSGTTTAQAAARSTAIEDPGWTITESVGQTLSCEVFTGFAGKRQAAINFLYQVLNLNEPCQLLLISEEPMDWLLTDRQFVQLWAALLLQIIRQGHHITIIHGLNRQISEIVTMLHYWMPLHLAGHLSSYYYPKYAERIIRHSQFILEGRQAVVAQSITAADQDDLTFVYRDAETIHYYTHIFQDYLKVCTPLFVLFSLNNIQDRLDEALHNNIMACSCIHLRHQLNSAFLPAAVLNQVLTGMNGQADEPTNSRLPAAWPDEYRQALQPQSAQHTVIDIIPLSFMERIRMDDLALRSDCDILLRQPLPLSQQDIKAWLQRTIDELRHNDRYELYLYPQSSTMEQMQVNISYWENCGALFSSADSSGNNPAIIKLNEANIIHSLSYYFDDFIHQIPSSQRNRAEVIQILEKVIHGLQPPDTIA